MKQKLSQSVTYWLGVVAIGLVVGLSLQFVRAWTEPSVAPPGGNVGAPINTGGITQTRSGQLTVNNNLIANNLGSTTLSVTPSANLATVGGNVGIGTASPDAKLDVNGGTGTAIRIAGGGDLQINSQVSGANSVLYNDTGALRVNTDICTDEGGGKCLSAAGGVLSNIRYWNFGEDTYSGASDLGRWCYEGSPIGDTCNGNIDAYYDCPTNVEKTCTDVFCEGDTPRTYKRTVTCLANYVYAKY